MLDPRQPGHPDHALHMQIERGVHALDAARGRSPDERSARLAAALLPLAKEHGLNRVDHVMVSRDNGRGIATGEHVFVVQGDPADPAHLRAYMRTADAIALPEQEAWQRAAQLQPATPALQPTAPAQAQTPAAPGV
jgi:hypothetical protein